MIRALFAGDICSNLHLTFKFQGQSILSMCEKKRTRQDEKKKYHIWQRSCLATGSAFSPIFHDTHTELWMQDGIASVCLCVCQYACLSKYLLTSECTKCTWSDWELTAWPQLFKANENKHTPSVLIGELLLNCERTERVHYKGLFSETTGKPLLVCYKSSRATPQVAHFLAVGVIVRKLQYPLTCWLKLSLL